MRMKINYQKIYLYSKRLGRLEKLHLSIFSFKRYSLISVYNDNRIKLFTLSFSSLTLILYKFLLLFLHSNTFEMKLNTNLISIGAEFFLFLVMLNVKQTYIFYILDFFLALFYRYIILFNQIMKREKGKKSNKMLRSNYNLLI